VAETYFRQMTAETPTRAWVNNPTLEEVDLALAQGAVGCTTNPAYG
jgi:transaldolase